MKHTEPVSHEERISIPAQDLSQAFIDLRDRRSRLRKFWDRMPWSWYSRTSRRIEKDLREGVWR